MGREAGSGKAFLTVFKSMSAPPPPGGFPLNEAETSAGLLPLETAGVGKAGATSAPTASPHNTHTHTHTHTHTRQALLDDVNITNPIKA